MALNGSNPVGSPMTGSQPMVLSHIMRQAMRLCLKEREIELEVNSFP